MCSAADSALRTSESGPRRGSRDHTSQKKPNLAGSWSSAGAGKEILMRNKWAPEGRVQLSPCSSNRSLAHTTYRANLDSPRCRVAVLAESQCGKSSLPRPGLVSGNRLWPIVWVGEGPFTPQPGGELYILGPQM